MTEAGTDRAPRWRSGHSHTFGLDRPAAGERRTLVVVAITAVTMVVEIAAGLLTGSMALLADGLHMASHAVALGIAAFAYRYTRRHASDPRFCFGTGKVNALAGFTGAVLLGVFAVGMAIESFERLVEPVAIAFDQALLVAVLGLLVNGACVLILGGAHHHPDDADDAEHDGHDGHDGPHHHDHNFRSAYLHVLADALTSLLAIGALLAAKHLQQVWLDPLMGVVGATLIARWSYQLLCGSGRVLLDRQAPRPVLDRIRAALEQDSRTRVTDLHVWSIGPGRRAAIVAIAADTPQEPEAYRARLPSGVGLEHVTIEVSRRRPGTEAPPGEPEQGGRRPGSGGGDRLGAGLAGRGPCRDESGDAEGRR